MKIETTRFGTLEVSEEKIISMRQGLLGFQDRKRFCIFQHQEGSPFFWYQSLDDPALAFVITNPWLFKPDYQIDLQAAVHAMEGDGESEDRPLECYVIVTIPQGQPEKMTANLVGPLVIDVKTCQAVQVVLPDDAYSHRHPLIEKEPSGRLPVLGLAQK